MCLCAVFSTDVIEIEMENHPIDYIKAKTCAKISDVIDGFVVVVVPLSNGIHHSIDLIAHV